MRMFWQTLIAESLAPVSLPNFERKTATSGEISCYGHLIVEDAARRPTIDFDVRALTTLDTLQAHFNRMEPAQRVRVLNMTQFSGETVLMKITRLACDADLSEILRSLLNWGAEYMV